MVGEGGDLALVVLGEPELGAGELLEEVRFGFGKDGEGTKQDAVAAGVLSAAQQLSAFAPNRHLQPLRKRGAGGDFIAADTGIQDVGVEVDDDGRFHGLGGLGRHVGDFVIGEALSPVVQDQASDLAPRIDGKSHGHAAEPFKAAGFGFRQQFDRDRREQDINRVEGLSPGLSVRPILDRAPVRACSLGEEPVPFATDADAGVQTGAKDAAGQQRQERGRNNAGQHHPAQDEQSLAGVAGAPEQQGQRCQAEARRKQRGRVGRIEHIVPQRKAAQRTTRWALVASGVWRAKAAADLGRLGTPVRLPFALEQQNTKLAPGLVCVSQDHHTTPARLVEPEVTTIGKPASAGVEQSGSRRRKREIGDGSLPERPQTGRGGDGGR